MAAHSPSTGKLVLVDYDVLRPLGEGGMGRIYLARHRETGRQVVVKVMREGKPLEVKALLARRG